MRGGFNGGLGEVVLWLFNWGYIVVSGLCHFYR